MTTPAIHYIEAGNLDNPVKVLNFLDPSNTPPEGLAKFKHLAQQYARKTDILPSEDDLYTLALKEKYGILYYLAGCEHSQTLFVRHYEKLVQSIGCRCCTYWRGRIYQALIDGAIFGAVLLYILLRH